MNKLVINENEYTVPSDMNLDDWMAAVKLGDNTNSFIAQAIGCPEENLELVPEETMLIVAAFLNEACFPKLSTNRSKLKNFDDFNFATFIDLEVYLSMGADSKMKEIVSLIFEDINPDEAMISQVWSGYLGYTNWRGVMFRNYKNLFNVSSGDEEGGPEVNIPKMWHDLLLVVANGDITKTDQILEMPVRKVLNWLAWNKEKQLEIQKKEQ